MFASRFFTYFTAALTGASLVHSIAAEPIIAFTGSGSGAIDAVAVKRQDTVEGNLKQSKEMITDDNISAPLQTIKDSSDDAQSALSNIEPAALVRFALKRQSNDEVANLVAGLLTSIINALDGLLDSLATAPVIGALFPASGVDASLAGVLHARENLLGGVLRLVANLLITVAALLRSLAFGFTLAALGL